MLDILKFFNQWTVLLDVCWTWQVDDINYNDSLFALFNIQNMQIFFIES